MTSKNISGGRGADEIVRAYLARPIPFPGASAGGTPITAPATTTPVVSIPAGVATTQDFYRIDKATILSVTTQTYRDFLRQAGYADLDNCTELQISKSLLKVNADLKNTATVITAREQAAGRQPPNWNFGSQADGSYVVNINQPDARKLVECLNGKILTTGLMYRLFIPYIKQNARTNADAQATLSEMQSKAEWLDDLVLNKNTLKVGSAERLLTFPNANNYFNPSDINEFGYPNAVHPSGEFYLWRPDGTPRAAVRSRVSELGLSLNRVPGFVFDVLGVRVAKFLP